ncbi:MAG: putative membrane protein, partial [Saprospiraceae bacterium]
MIIKNKVPILYLFHKIKVDLLWVLCINIGVTILLTQVSDKIPEMPLNIPAFLGTAISVLLSFKMAQSYDRWWEARQIWGVIVNDSRTLVLQLQGFCPDGNLEKIKTIALRQIAWCYTLVNRL